VKKLNLFQPFLSIIAGARDPRAVAREYVPRLERNLKEIIVPFWLQRSLDQKNGGYIIGFGPGGEPLKPEVKMIVTQARQAWFFSRLVREGYGNQQCLEAAALGYRFLREKMWDYKHGGFYWQVDAAGEKVLLPGKVIYGQSFGLYAVSEYYLASKKADVQDFARTIFELMEAKAYDGVYGGYLETFNEDWSPKTLDHQYMGKGPAIKLMNTHLHLMEAMTNFYRAICFPLARERLLELITIQSNSVVRKAIGACTDKYERNWTPILTGNNSMVSYGHDLENIWLIADACDAAGIPTHTLLDLYRTLFNYSLKYGFDRKKGGFYTSGVSFNRPATDRNKTWWVQAEAIVSALCMFRLTNEPQYLDIFARTYDYIEKYQVDWINGEWHAVITPRGKIRGNKADPWKAAYHNGRAIMECLNMLKVQLAKC